jgi:hypothetical protein
MMMVMIRKEEKTRGAGDALLCLPTWLQVVKEEGLGPVARRNGR